jgi:ADP-L-glycero-D-manno-heptose 6-epimerase
MMNGGRVLLTGSAGFIGRATVETLSRAGFEVTGVDRVAGHRCGAAATELTLDFGDRALLSQVEAGRYDAVVHLAAIVDTTARDRAVMRHENTDKPLELATRARRGGASFVCASSFSVYGRIADRRPIAEGEERGEACSGPLNAYAESKLLLDQALSESLDGEPFWAALRLTNVFGRGEERKGPMASMAHKLARACAAGEPVLLFEDTLDAARDYVPVEAVAQRIARALGGPGAPGVYNLGSGTAVSFAELLEWCRVRAPHHSELVLAPNPVADAYQYWTCADMRRWESEFADGADARISKPQVRAAVERLVDRFAC